MKLTTNRLNNKEKVILLQKDKKNAIVTGKQIGRAHV